MSFENDQSQQNLFVIEQECLEMTEPAKVLIIHDDEMTIKMIQQVMANSSHSLDSAEDANQGIKMITKRVNLTRSGVKMYKLIILDNSMPNVDGPVLIGIIKTLVESLGLEAPLICCCTASSET